MGKKELIIKQNDAGQRLDKFLTKTYPYLPQSILYKAVRVKDIKINGKRCSASDKLKIDDRVYMFLKDEFLRPKEKQHDFSKAPITLNIIYEDNNILLVDKQPGLIVHPDEQYHFDSLIARIQHYLYDKKEFFPEEENSFTPALVNRLDRNTGGIVIAAKNAEALRILNQKMKNRELEKYYFCLVKGQLKEKSALLDDFLEKNESNNKVYISNNNTENSKRIQTAYKVIDECKSCSLVEVKLLTGRTHQIRAHFAHIGHPLLGDAKYGNHKNKDSTPIKHQALYSYKLTFSFNEDAGILNYLNHRTFEVKNIWLLDMFNNFKLK